MTRAVPQSATKRGAGSDPGAALYVVGGDVDEVPVVPFEVVDGGAVDHRVGH